MPPPQYLVKKILRGGILFIQNLNINIRQR